MNAQEFLRSFPYGYGVVPCLVGDTGVGKTTIVKSVFPDAHVVILSQIPPSEVGGIPNIIENSHTFRYRLPEWASSDCIYFDEIDKASASVISAILLILSHYEIHGQRITPRIILGGQFSDMTEVFSGDGSDTMRALSARAVFFDVTEDGLSHINNLYRSHGYNPPNITIKAVLKNKIHLGLVTPRKAQFFLINKEFAQAIGWTFSPLNDNSANAQDYTPLSLIEAVDIINHYNGKEVGMDDKLAEAIAVTLLKWRDGTEEDRRIIGERLNNLEFQCDSTWLSQRVNYYLERLHGYGGQR